MSVFPERHLGKWCTSFEIMLGLCSAAFSCDRSLWALGCACGLLIGPVHSVSPVYVLLLGMACASPKMEIVDDLETFVRRKGVKINYGYAALMWLAYGLYLVAYGVRGQFRGKRRISFHMFARIVWLLHVSRCLALLTKAYHRTCTD